MVEHMHIPRKIQYMEVASHIPSLVMLHQGDKTQDYTISLLQERRSKATRTVGQKMTADAEICPLCVVI